VRLLALLGLDDGVREVGLFRRRLGASVSERAAAEGVEQFLLHGFLDRAVGVVARALGVVGEQVVRLLDQRERRRVAALIRVLLLREGRGRGEGQGSGRGRGGGGPGEEGERSRSQGDRETTRGSILRARALVMRLRYARRISVDVAVEETPRTAYMFGGSAGLVSAGMAAGGARGRCGRGVREATGRSRARRD
jgi:hypothetical protein